MGRKVYRSQRVGRLPPWPPDALFLPEVVPCRSGNHPADHESHPVTASASAPTCSARGCREPAAVALVWRNPRIHGPEREKRWLACERHRSSLADFLAARDFPLRVDPL
jgi:hypothetical protein